LAIVPSDKRSREIPGGGYSLTEFMPSAAEKLKMLVKDSPLAPYVRWQ
jgi:hypothetical protein